MKTRVLALDPAAPQREALSEAARVLQGGGLVAFPTETVYGLGVHALDAVAVARLFAAKGRPPNNPLIVHVLDVGQAQQVVAEWPETAALLAERFWPGPLTLVLRKQATVPAQVTAGGPTVAVRVPAHPVALELLRAAALPIAAPSANRSSQLSPTRAAHVLQSLDGRIDLLLDAGPTAGGIESTVVDLTTTTPRLLRPGLLGIAELEALLGPLARTASPHDLSAGPLPAPGMLPRHYAPCTPVEIVASVQDERIADLLREGRRVAVLLLAKAKIEMPGVVLRVLPADPVGYAAQLYAVLHELDAAGLDRILVEFPPNTDEWLAVRDRLRRAASD